MRHRLQKDAEGSFGSWRAEGLWKMPDVVSWETLVGDALCDWNES